MRVVVADDSLLTREGIVRLLGDAGIEVVAQAENGNELLDQVCAHAPDVAVVGVVERAEFVAQVVFEVNVPADLTVPVAAEDLLELLGALIENAGRYAKRRVRIDGKGRRDSAKAGGDNRRGKECRQSLRMRHLGSPP